MTPEPEGPPQSQAREQREPPGYCFSLEVRPQMAKCDNRTSEKLGLPFLSGPLSSLSVLGYS